MKKPLLIKKLILVFCSFFCLMGMEGQETFFEFIPGWRASSIHEEMNGEYVIRTDVLSIQPNDQFIGSVRVDEFGSVLSDIEINNDSLIWIQSGFGLNSARLDSDVFWSGTLKGISGVGNGYLGKLAEDLSDFDQLIVMDSCCYGNSGGPLTALSDGNLLHSGYRLTQEFYNYTSLSKYTTGLDRIWTRHFYCEDDTLNGTLQPYATLELDDGSILLTGLADYFVGGSGADDYVQTILIRTDAQGNEIWRSRPGDTANFWIDPGMPIQLDNGNIMAFWSDNYDRNGWLNPPNFDNTIHFGELDIETGELLWEDDLDDELLTSNEDSDRSHLYSLKQAQILFDGSILLTGYDLREALFIKMSQAGEVDWIRFHIPEEFLQYSTQNNVDTWLFEVIETSDGGFAGVGEFRADPGGDYPQGFQSAFVIKLDENGCLEQGCEVGIEEFQLGELDLYPNPSAGIIYIEIPDITPFGIIEIIDMTGRTVMKKDVTQAGKMILELSLVSGIYQVSYRIENGSYLTKLVVE